MVLDGEGMVRDGEGWGGGGQGGVRRGDERDEREMR